MSSDFRQLPEAEFANASNAPNDAGGRAFDNAKAAHDSSESNEEALLLYILRLLNGTAYRKVLTPVERAFLEGAHAMFSELSDTCRELLDSTMTEREFFADESPPAADPATEGDMEAAVKEAVEAAMESATRTAVESAAGAVSNAKMKTAGPRKDRRKSETTNGKSKKKSTKKRSTKKG